MLVLCLGGGALFFRPYLSDEYPAHLSTPAQVAGLARSDDPALAEAALELAAMISGELALNDRITAVYLPPDNQEQAVAVFGGTALLRTPERELDQAFQSADAAGFPVAEVRAVEPGPAGGIAKCGQSAIEDLPMSVCGWADHGSLAVGFFFFREVAESAELLRKLRAEIRSE